MGRVRDVLLLAALLAPLAAAPAAAQLPPIGEQPPGQEQEEDEPKRDPPPVTPPPDPGTDWVVEGGDAAHRFWAGDSGVAPPLEVRWTASVAPRRPGVVRVAGGLVVVQTSDENYDQAIVAFDAATGARRWEVHVGTYITDVAIGAGRLLVSVGQELRAYDLATGAHAWTQPVDSYLLTPHGGEAYFWAAHDRDGPGGSNAQVALHAIDAATGRELWRGEEETSDWPHGRVMVSGDRIFHATICETTAYDRRDGAEIWRQGPSCTGGWQSEFALAGDKVVGDDRVLSAADGSTVRDSFPRDARVIAGDRVVTVSDDDQAAVAQDIVGGGELWRWSDDPETFTSATFAAAGDRVWVQRGENVTLLDRLTGAPQWAGLLRGGDGPPIVAGGLAIMRREHDVVALGAASTRPPRVALKVSDDAVEYGEDVRLGVTVEYPELTMAGPVAVQLDEFPASGFVPGPVLQTTIQGGAETTVRPSRVTAYRAEAQGGVSEARAVMVLPRVRLRSVRTRSSTVRLHATVEVPPEAGLRRRLIGVYVARRGGRRYDRVGTGRLRGNRGRFTATIRARRTRIGRRGFVTVCIRGLRRHGLGYGDRLERRCGARRVRGTAPVASASAARAFSAPAARAARASRGTRWPPATR